MGSTVKKLVGMGSKVMNKIEDTVSGGAGTSDTLLSKIVDPLRKQRQHNAAGGGTKPADMLDPNSELHANDNPDEIKAKSDAADAAAQYEEDKLKAPDLASSTLSSQQESDRLRRRRGILANIFAGSSGGGSTSVGTKTLLGG